MEVIRERSAWREALEALRDKSERIGLVPTMGALHDGHLSLVSAARRSGHLCALSIFVNPLQFGDAADLDAYPRDLETDLGLADDAGVAVVFAPSVAEMYPEGAPSTTVVPGPAARVLEGRSRPAHFEGVATVLTKLFSLTGACSAYFGEKDFQQLVVVRKLASDLDLPVEVVGCPTVREPDGLAMSSRNRRLSPPGRNAALALHRSLATGRRLLEAGEVDPERVEAAMGAVLEAEELVVCDYVAVADAATLERPGRVGGEVRLLVAATVEGVRLIDNMPGPPARP